MSLKSSIIYFMLGNYYYHKEIGNYINESIKDKYSQSDLNEIICKSKNILENSENNLKVNTKYKETFNNYILYYVLISSNIFYISAVTKDFESNFNEDEIFELFSDIETQGIKKLTDKNGELSRIGRQNLKFCIEQNYQRINKETNTILGFFQSQNSNSDISSKQSLLSTHVNETHTDNKEERKKFLDSESEINKNKINEKNEEVKIDFKDDELTLLKRRKCRKISFSLCIILTIMAIITICIYFFRYK